MTEPTPENEPRPRRRRRQAEPPPPQGSAVRGVVLVVVAVAIGFLLLRDSDSRADPAAVGARDDVSESTDDPTSTTTSSTVAARTPAEVKVVVANGSDVDGAAGNMSEQLKGLGYVTATPTDSPERVTATVVHHTDGYEAEATKLAADIDAPEGAVAPLPTPAPVDMQESNVLVILGPELASPG